MERFGDCSRIASGNEQERKGSAIRCPASLLPVAQRRHTHADHEGKLCLRRLECIADGLHIGRSKGHDSCRFERAPANPPSLANTRDQFIGMLRLSCKFLPNEPPRAFLRLRVWRSGANTDTPQLDRHKHQIGALPHSD